SDWSRERPNWPPRADTENKNLSSEIRRLLSGTALIQARRWEQTIPEELTLLGLPKDADSKLYLTYVRLRWFLFEQCNSDFNVMSRSVGPDCVAAVRTLEAGLKSMQKDLPTRVLLISVANRSQKNATDLKIDITAGGKIYDATINGEQESKVVE